MSYPSSRASRGGGYPDARPRPCGSCLRAHVRQRLARVVRASSFAGKHRSTNSREVVRLGVSLLVTFTAIVLGLLTTSVKGGFTPPIAIAATSPLNLPSSTDALATTAPRRRSFARNCAVMLRASFQHVAGLAASCRKLPILIRPKCGGPARRLPWLSCCTKLGLISSRSSRRMHCKDSGERLR